VPFRPYSQSDIARLGELAEVLNDCRAAFRDVVDQTNWTAAPGCPAANDQNDIAKDEDYTAGAEFKITKLLFFYLLAASEQLGGLAALYAQQEVLIPPSALIRSTIEHCAHALWVVGHPGEPVQDRLARAYVEELLSAEAAKRNSGYMLGEDDELHLQEVERFRALKAEIRAGFPEELTYEKSRPVLRGQKVLTPEECVAWMFEFVSRPVPAKVTEGVYGVYSNSTHPTLYAIARLWVREQHKGQMTLAPALSVKDHENELFPAIVAFYEALSYVIDYHGWPRARHDQLTADIEAALPGLIVAP
jgi:hypothetical protein